MSGPVETTGILLFAAAAFCAALFVVPLPKPKKDEPKPPAIERLTDRPETHEEAAQVAPVVAPAPPPPELEIEGDDERLMILEQSVNEIKRDQQELKSEIRALVKELKGK